MAIPTATGTPVTATGQIPRELTAAAVPDLTRLRLAAVFTLGLALFGILAHDLVAQLGISGADHRSGNAFFRLYVLNEAPHLWVLALAGALTWLSTRVAGKHAQPTWESKLLVVASRVPPWAVPVAVLGLTAFGGAVVLHGIGLSMDEFTVSFQARIFASGRLQAAVPAEWRELAPWMTPVFVNYKPTAGVWVSSYLPGYAAIRAVFATVGIESLTNPVLAALSIVLISGIARRVWMGDDAARSATLAVLFLGLSAQFIVTSMSGYSMTAHLCLNLLWLWLYVRGDKAALTAAPWVGVLAMGLHNPIPHALFVAPFLVRLVRERRLGWLAYFAAVYLVGAASWYEWLQFVQRDVDGSSAIIGAGMWGDGIGGGVFHQFRIPRLFGLFVQGMSVALLFAWQTPALLLFLPVALLGWRRLGAVERDLAAGLIATWLFFVFFADQGHGWGNRYMHAVLGNAVLLAVAGALAIWRSGRQAVVARLVVASALVTLVVQWPLRALQTERFVRPYAAAHEYVATRPVQLVVLDPQSVWYGRDFVRNDPFLAGTPKVLGVAPIRGRYPSQAALPASARGQVHAIVPSELAKLGVPVIQRGDSTSESR